MLRSEDDPGRSRNGAENGADTDSLSDAARLDALRELQLSESGLEETFDVFTRLAGDLLDAPVSLVSLVEAERQVFLSQRGLSGEPAERGEVPISHSICRYAVGSGEPLVIGDAREDPLVRDNPAVKELGVVAYAGFPLILADGTAVGALCAIDSEPRRWTGRELALLADLAAAVRKILDLRAELVDRGLHDRLTGLPNRELLVASCKRMVRELGPGGSVAVACAGIDHFNLVNQALGTENADEVLRAVAQRLQAVTGEGDVFGRLRGDVFTLITRRPRGEAELLEIVDEIHGALAAGPLEGADEPLSLHATVGVATGGREAHGADLISQAANAMREAKRQRGRVRIAQADWTRAAADQLRMREALSEAVERGEMSAVFQPVRELESGRVVAFEALARWAHPDLGQVSPGDFIRLAELTGDIFAIGEFVLERSAELAARLRRIGAGDLRVGINVSPVQLERPEFAEAVAAILERAGVDGSAIGVEITEGALLETGDAQERNLRTLREADVHVVLDDFGTGYSALGYLREFPIQTVKIDRMFVRDLGRDQVAAALVQAILAMAKGMAMFVVAEGIETEDQARLLRALGCEFGQGFGLGRPAPAERALEELAG
jgi:diguanylate cyclase (GGDEF)-like protein